MPEGPEIRRAADGLMQAMSHLPITLAWFAFPHLKRWETQLTGQTIDKIEARGKALLTWFSNGLVLYSHNQLYGVWRVVKAGETPVTKRDLRVRLENHNAAILLYSASEISMLSADEVTEHPFLLRIGPDALDLQLTVETVQARLMSKRFCGRQLGALLLDQSFIAGLGNYLRVEILWQARLAAHHRPRDLNIEQQRLLCQAILDILRLSYTTRGQPGAKDHHGATFRFRAFHRAGKACERCGHAIEKTTFSGRPFYWCPGCQQ
ncbi:endonuclease VIII [Candidatus Sodalis pierantonius str. SOPE]|uniref:Endonuclease 8 n=1 Tax=Candidatus Sodalis pierantonii str. SOPE TaxID=2342 RepID=W0HJQ5_9GAMM|nr:endonuclease VIII [Candidatus Sodalis pierantonius]AHF74019.1 endonuclease VIII [Candidatus Sodalis pierantonius str. SOPE]